MKYILFCLKAILLFLLLPAISFSQLKTEEGIFTPYKDFIAVTPEAKNAKHYFIARLSKSEISANKKKQSICNSETIE